MKNLLNGAVAGTMASLFIVMFWAQLGGIATAFARAKAESHAVASDHYTLIQRLQPVY